jgi:hypothetical protein
VARSGEVGPQDLQPQGQRATRTSRLLVAIRVLFAVLTVGALVSGYFGLLQFVHTLPSGAYGTNFQDIFYYDLQLFVLSSEPLNVSASYPLLLEIARFAAPSATALALVEAAHALFAGRWRSFRERNRSGHSIVVGDTPVARAIVAALRLGGATHVSWITEGSPESLLAAGVRGASYVYACGDDTKGDDTLNVVTAQTAATAQRRSNAGSLCIYAQVTDPMLALSLRARRLGQAGSPGVDVDFFTVDVLAARACLGPRDFPTASDGEAHITIAGWGTFARSLLIEYAQLWQLEADQPRERLKVTVVGATQAEVVDVASRWDVIREVCDVTAVAPEAAPWLTPSRPSYRTFICYDDENLALTTALTAARLWTGGPDSVVVRLSRLALPADPKQPKTLKLIDNVGGRLRVVSVTALACDPKLIHAEDIIERLAQSIHRRYVLAQRSDRTPMHSSKVMNWWIDLDEEFRAANRAPARHIGVKLELIGATVAPRTGAPIEFAYTPAEMETLARAEHDRWSAERRSRGWKPGPRDNDKKLHPSLVPWEQLPESERDKDRDAVRDLDPVLADAGLQMVRLAALPLARPVLPEQVSLSS